MDVLDTYTGCIYGHVSLLFPFSRFVLGSLVEGVKVTLPLVPLVAEQDPKSIW